MYAREIITRAIVMARHSAGEGSMRVQLYSENLGLVTALAKSGREERSKLRSHLQLGTRGVFRIVKGKDVWRVAGASETENVHFAAGEKKENQEAASRVFSAVRQFVRGEGRDDVLFDTLWNFSTSLPLLAGEEVRSAESLAILRMLAALGYVAADHSFVTPSYDAETLSRAFRERPVLIKTINEGIAASGL
jgi:recombinational DNA repair protein (RecF pathway)